MGITILAYNHVPEISGLIEKVKTDFAGDFRFVLPSPNDKFWWPDKKIQSENLWTWDEIYKDISNENRTRRKILSPPDQLLILNSILKKFLAEYPERVKALPGLARPGFLNVISRDIRELLNEAIKPTQLEFNPESLDASEFLLPQVYATYIEYLENYNLLDSAQICTTTLEEIIKNQTWGRNFVIVFGGFLSFTHSQLELVGALRDRCDEVIILKPETSLKRFYDADLQLRGVSSSMEKSSGKIIKIPVAEPGLEPEVIARNLALSDKIKNFDEVGIMIERGREAAFAEAFERYGVPYDFVSGIGINLTLPGKILSAIRHLNSRSFPTYETAMLLTQPCFAGSKFPVMSVYKAGCSGLDAWEEYLRARFEENNNDHNEVFKIALLSIQAIRKFRDVMAREAKPEKLMSAFYEFLTTENLWLDRFASREIAEIPELDETIRLTANAIETIGEKVLALSELLPDLGAVQNERLRADEAYDFLERWCANTNTRAPLQISNAVRVFTGTPPVLSFFPVWIMTGVTQKTWSANVNSSPLLGVSERDKLAAKKAFLPSIVEKAAQHEALFRRLIQVGERFTVISRPELDEEGRPLSESPFLEKFREEMPWTIENNQSGGIKILLGSDGFTFPEIDASEKISRKPPEIFTNANAVGASDVHKLLSCPFLWWQEKQANLYPKDTDIATQIDWGLMLHKYWERLWRRYRIDTTQDFLKLSKDEWNRLTSPEDFGGEIEDYKNFSRLVKDFRLKRKLSGIKYRVQRLSELQAKIINKLHEAGYRHERILLENEAHLKADKDGIIFLGQCDRIEFLISPTGERIAFIADYKEGDGAKSEDPMTKIQNYSWNTEGREKFACGLQLSVYAALFKQNYDVNLCGVYILGLEDGKISGSFLNDEDNADIFKIFSDHKSKKFKTSILERVDEGEYAISCAAGVLKAGRFAPEYQSDLCRFCKIKSICRKGEFKGEILEDEDESETSED